MLLPKDKPKVKYGKNKYFFDKIVDIKEVKIKRTVYDFTVPDSHSFIANGFVSSNTPCGVGNLFHRMWSSKTNGYKKSQFGWWWLYSEEEIEAIRAETNDPLKFAQEYEMSFLASGRQVFPVDMIQKVQKSVFQVGEKIQLGEDDPYMVNCDLTGLVKYLPPRPGAIYVIGADVSEGVNGGDYSTACVMNRQSGEQVASFRGIINPSLFAAKLIEWGKLYNTAMICVEVNNHGLTTLTALKNASYPNLYYRPTSYDQISSGVSDRLGWRTTTVTRPLLIDDMKRMISDGSVVFHDEELSNEMLTFVFDDNGRMDHQKGYHDDAIFAAAISLQAFKVTFARAPTQIEYKNYLPKNFNY